MSNIELIAEARVLAKMISAPYSGAFLAAVNKIEEMDAELESLRAQVTSLNEAGERLWQTSSYWHGEAHSLTKQLTAAKEQNALLTLDAERYRWLVANAHPIIQFKIEWKGRLSDWTPDKDIVSVQYYTWDAVANSIDLAIKDSIDAAISQEPMHTEREE